MRYTVDWMDSGKSLSVHTDSFQAAERIYNCLIDCGATKIRWWDGTVEGSEPYRSTY